MSISSITGTIFAIKRYGLARRARPARNGLLKGCPLSCLWCHNPEGMRFGTEIHTHRANAWAAGDCAVPACPVTLRVGQAKIIVRDPPTCTACVDMRRSLSGTGPGGCGADPLRDCVSWSRNRQRRAFFRRHAGRRDLFPEANPWRIIQTSCSFNLRSTASFADSTPSV